MDNAWTTADHYIAVSEDLDSGARRL